MRTGVGDLLGALLARGLRAAGPRAYAHVLDTLWERQPPRPVAGALRTMALECPPLVRPDPAERPLVERLFRAFRRAKLDPLGADPRTAPREPWSETLRRGYAPLALALERDDVEVFHHFLANFAGWEQDTGIEESSRLRRLARDPRKARHFERRALGPLLDWWLASEAGEDGLEAIALPPIGNPCGVRVGASLVSRLAITADVHARLLARAVGRPGAAIAELGCGAGRMALALSRHCRPARYVGLDLPEPLCCASYLLLRAMPGARALLYGEEELAPGWLERFDLALLPAREIVRLPIGGFDLFVNENSLGEMHPESARLFVGEICRATRLFWHRNHETWRWRFGDGAHSLLPAEYPIPESEFACLARYADATQSVGSPWPRRDRDLYWYLYARRGARP